MKTYLFESVKELNEYLEAHKSWKKPKVQHNFQVVDTSQKDEEQIYTIVDRFFVIEE